MPDPDPTKEQNSGGDGNPDNPEGGQESPTVTITDAEGRKITMDAAQVQTQLDRAREKERGADERFRNLAAERKAGQEAIQLVKDIKEAQKTGDPEAGARLVKAGILSQADWDAAIAQRRAFEAANPQKGETEEDYRPVGEEDLSEDLQRDLKAGRAARMEQAEAKLTNIIDAVLDRDELLGTVLNDVYSGDQGLREEVRSQVRRVLVRRAQEAHRAGDKQWRPDAHDWKLAVQETQRWLQRMRILDTEEDASPDGVTGTRAAAGARKPKLPTAGPSPVSPAHLHRPTKPPKRVPATDPGHGAWLAEAIAHSREHGIPEEDDPFAFID